MNGGKALVGRIVVPLTALFGAFSFGLIYMFEKTPELLRSKQRRVVAARSHVRLTQVSWRCVRSL